jgi:hypothetical protein
MSAIIDQSLDELKDRLVNGDIGQNHRGEVIRKPVQANTLAYILSQSIDKLQTVRGEPEKREIVVEKLPEKQVDRLEKLAETFESLAKFGRKPKIIDMEDVSAKAIGTKIENEGKEDGSVEGTSGSVCVRDASQDGLDTIDSEKR